MLEGRKARKRGEGRGGREKSEGGSTGKAYAGVPCFDGGPEDLACSSRSGFEGSGYVSRGRSEGAQHSRSPSADTRSAGAGPVDANSDAMTSGAGRKSGARGLGLGRDGKPRSCNTYRLESGEQNQREKRKQREHSEHRQPRGRGRLTFTSTSNARALHMNTTRDRVDQARSSSARSADKHREVVPGARRDETRRLGGTGKGQGRRTAQEVELARAV
ncbi:hypothetical protein C8T65DRAFT_28062 [Cerioporus squamosus]|nr:hypothetical protein C8T65DRAFT_28062 [Cerioporus squamosus]